MAENPFAKYKGQKSENPFLEFTQPEAMPKLEAKGITGSLAEVYKEIKRLGTTL